MNEKNNLSITISTTQGNWENAVFPKNAKVQEVIIAVIEHFSFASNGNYELRKENEPETALKPERPLVSYKINDGDVLIFTDLGVAVWL